MSHDNWLPSLNKHPLFSGLPQQVNSWNQVFQIRLVSPTRGLYYVAWKESNKMVENSPYFNNWLEAKSYIASNWQKYIDEQFEREVLVAEHKDKA